MRSTAYLVVFLETGTGAFKGAGIFSEAGSSLTVDRSSVTPATVFDCSAGSYQEAHDLILDECKRYSHLRWLVPVIK
jgi:hypothetical protein